MIEPSVARGGLWAALSKTGTRHHAVLLALNARSAELISNELRQCELEAILASLVPSTPAVVGRRDRPTLVTHGGKASLTETLAAAQPNQRKRALEDL